MLFSPEAFEHLLVLSPDLLPGACGEVGVDQSEIGTVEFNQLIVIMITSSNLSSSYVVQGPASAVPG